MATVRLLMACINSVSMSRSFFTRAVFKAPIQIQMPALSPTMEEGTITKWLIAEGDTVEIGDAICEVETDKAVVTMEANEEGTLAKILIPEGTSNIKISVPIAILAEEGEDVKEAANVVIDSPPAILTPAPHAEAKFPPTAPPPEKSQFFRSQLSPAVRQTIQQYNIDSNQIIGTGPKGLILKGDVLNYIKANNIQPKKFDIASVPDVKTSPVESSPVTHFTSVKQNTAKKINYEDIDLSNVRKVIAKRLTESKQQIPHSYSSIQCSISKLLRIRKELAKEGHKFSVNDFVVKAAARTLRQVPEVNSVWKGGAVEQSGAVDVSVAVATDGGLITPIIKDAASKGLSELNSELKELAGRARLGKLKPEEFQGGTFTISNLGMFGVREFTAVINPPQSSIMAVGGTRVVPSSRVIDIDVDEDIIETQNRVDNVMTVTLSSDARVIDDVIASKFLEKFKRNIENPLMLGLL